MIPMTPMTKRSKLALIANEQGGYFTAHQALQAGYSYPEQNQQMGYGNWVKVQRGIYRLRDFPHLAGSRDDLIALTLLSCDRSGEPQAVVSHESALVIHEISDANPAHTHSPYRLDFASVCRLKSCFTKHDSHLMNGKSVRVIA